MYKKTIIIVLVLIVASLFWFWLKPWIDSPTRFSDVSIWLTPLLLLTFLASLIGLAFILFKNIGLRITVSVVTGLPFFVIFGFNPFFAGTFALMVLFHLYTSKNMQEERDERTKINSRSILQKGLPLVIMPILIMVSFAFYLSLGVQATAKSKQLPPTVRQVVETTVNNFLGQQVESLPAQERQKAKDQVLSQVLEQMTTFAEPYLQFLPPILAFGLFLVLQGLSFIFVWLSILFGWLMFQVLKKSGLVRINIAQREAEELEF